MKAPAPCALSGSADGADGQAARWVVSAASLLATRARFSAADGRFLLSNARTKTSHFFHRGALLGHVAPAVIAMQPNEIAECPRLTAADRWLASVDAPLGFQRPFFRVLAAKTGVVDILPLPSDLDAPRPRFELGKGRHGVCAPCALRRRTGAKIVAPWRRKECTRGDLTS
jgi:hypothetical protein